MATRNAKRSAAGVGALLLATSLPVAGWAHPQERIEGKAAVEAMCTSCHSVRSIEHSAGYTREGWQSLIATMIDLDESPLQDPVLDYLAETYPPNDRRAAKRITGSTEIRFTSWLVPTLGQRARDPVQAPDGTIWWVGQSGNILGQIDPVSGAMREYTLPANAHPHSVEIDHDGRVWYTGNRNASVGMLKPGTDEFVVYEMPDPKARDPHTAIFDDDNTMFFTLQQANMIGRLFPETGEITLVSAPTPGSRPYGIKLDSQGTLWVACNGSNCLLSIDRDTMQITEHKLPQPQTTVRRLDVAADDSIWYVNSRLGFLGHYDPATGKAKEWPSPSGANSHPYALVIVDGIVWYNESGVRPDMLVRFDPATEQFQSWPVPSGDIYAGIIRHMRATREGDILIHQSSTNRILRVEIE